jgi:hypothetical protein
VDHARTKDFRAAMAHSFPEGMGQGQVLSLLTENGFRYEWRQPTSSRSPGEHLVARRVRKAPEYGAYVYDTWFRFEDGILVERYGSEVNFVSSGFATPLNGGMPSRAE